MSTGAQFPFLSVLCPISQSFPSTLTGHAPFPNHFPVRLHSFRHSPVLLEYPYQPYAISQSFPSSLIYHYPFANPSREPLQVMPHSPIISQSFYIVFPIHPVIYLFFTYQFSFLCPFQFLYLPFPIPLTSPLPNNSLIAYPLPNHTSFPNQCPYQPFPIPHSLFPIPHSLLHILYSPSPTPCSQFSILWPSFPTPCSPFPTTHLPLSLLRP